MANPHDFLEDKFLDVGVYANALDLYKEDLVDLRDQLKIKVSFSVRVFVCVCVWGGVSFLWKYQGKHCCSSLAFTGIHT